MKKRKIEITMAVIALLAVAVILIGTLILSGPAQKEETGLELKSEVQNNEISYKQINSNTGLLIGYVNPTTSCDN